MDDRSKPAEAAPSSGLWNDHCTELEHSENVAASEQAQSRGTGAYRVQKVDLFPTLPKIELNRRGFARAGWDAWGHEVVAAVAIEAAPPRSQQGRR